MRPVTKIINFKGTILISHLGTNFDSEAEQSWLYLNKKDWLIHNNYV